MIGLKKEEDGAILKSFHPMNPNSDNFKDDRIKKEEDGAILKSFHPMNPNSDIFQPLYRSSAVAQ
ncbi:MAG TPA: hypothetical protein VGK10_04025 [Prolixibacteraceae bacterium]|jgi:hypothetical protein